MKNNQTASFAEWSSIRFLHILMFYNNCQKFFYNRFSKANAVGCSSPKELEGAENLVLSVEDEQGARIILDVLTSVTKDTNPGMRKVWRSMSLTKMRICFASGATTVDKTNWLGKLTNSFLDSGATGAQLFNGSLDYLFSTY